MAVGRRIGAQSSTSRAALMDAVEGVMREDGYGALTARRVAQHANLNYQLVFYYFETMDGLLVATYRRHIAKYREMLEQALKSERPLHAYWTVSSNSDDGVLNMEFMALSNHNEAVRAETIRFGEEFRSFNLEHISPAIIASQFSRDLFEPGAIMALLNYVSSVLGLETALGISGKHAEIRALVDWCVERLEPQGTSG